MRLLGIETSCDETSAAVIEVNRGRFVIKANIVASQISIHSRYGGVIPEIAARNHIQNILPVINQALTAAKTKPAAIDRIAATCGPGLISALLVGEETAKGLAAVWRKPIVGVNHLAGHLYAPWLLNQPIRFPAVALIVSGGHTELHVLRSAHKPKLLGQTIDDAAGEAFDKVGQLLKLGYPGGPAISKIAAQGDPTAFDLPRPMLKSNDLNFSFSGLKTAVRYTIEKWPKITKPRVADLAASFQQAAVDVLVAKAMTAITQHKAKTLLLSGGVAANTALRQQLAAATKEHGCAFLVPPIALCTDNAAMIAAAGFFGKPIPWQQLRVDPNLVLSS